MVQHYFKNNVAEHRNVCGLCKVSNDIEHVFLACPKWGAFRIAIYDQAQKLNLPITLSTLLGEQFNHDIYQYYLRVYWCTHV